MKYRVKLIDGVNYRPEKIRVNGEMFTADNYSAAHGYTWRTSPYGNVLYYRSAGGCELAFMQKDLYNLKKEDYCNAVWSYIA